MPRETKNPNKTLIASLNAKIKAFLSDVQKTTELDSPSDSLLEIIHKYGVSSDANKDVSSSDPAVADNDDNDAAPNAKQLLKQFEEISKQYQKVTEGRALDLIPESAMIRLLCLEYSEGRTRPVFQKLASSHWKLSLKRLKETFSARALLSETLVRELQHFASAAPPSLTWETAKAAICGRREKRLSTKAKGIPKAKWHLPGDVTAARADVGVPPKSTSMPANPSAPVGNPLPPVVPPNDSIAATHPIIATTPVAPAAPSAKRPADHLLPESPAPEKDQISGQDLYDLSTAIPDGVTTRPRKRPKLQHDEQSAQQSVVVEREIEVPSHVESEAGEDMDLGDEEPSEELPSPEQPRRHPPPEPLDDTYSNGFGAEWEPDDDEEEQEKEENEDFVAQQSPSIVFGADDTIDLADYEDSTFYPEAPALPHDERIETGQAIPTQEAAAGAKTQEMVTSDTANGALLDASVKRLVAEKAEAEERLVAEKQEAEEVSAENVPTPGFHDSAALPSPSGPGRNAQPVLLSQVPKEEKACFTMTADASAGVSDAHGPVLPRQGHVEQGLPPSPPAQLSEEKQKDPEIAQATGEVVVVPDDPEVATTNSNTPGVGLRSLPDLLGQLQPGIWLDSATIQASIISATSSRIWSRLHVDFGSVGRNDRLDQWNPSPRKRGSSKSLILVPFHLPARAHWVLICINQQTQTVSLHDSMQQASNDHLTCVAKAMVRSLGQDWRLDQWKFVANTKNVQQIGTDDCGVFVIVYALMIMSGHDLKTIDGDSYGALFGLLVARAFDQLPSPFEFVAYLEGQKLLSGRNCPIDIKDDDALLTSCLTRFAQRLLQLDKVEKTLTDLSSLLTGIIPTQAEKVEALQHAKRRLDEVEKHGTVGIGWQLLRLCRAEVSEYEDQLAETPAIQKELSETLGFLNSCLKGLRLDRTQTVAQRDVVASTVAEVQSSHQAMDHLQEELREERARHEERTAALSKDYSDKVKQHAKILEKIKASCWKV